MLFNVDIAGNSEDVPTKAPSMDNFERNGMTILFLFRLIFIYVSRNGNTKRAVKHATLFEHKQRHLSGHICNHDAHFEGHLYFFNRERNAEKIQKRVKFKIFFVYRFNQNKPSGI